MSFGGLLPKRAVTLSPATKSQLEILRRAVDRAEVTALSHMDSAILDHLDHIRTELERLKIMLEE